jgi:hypothetical protein
VSNTQGTYTEKFRSYKRNILYNTLTVPALHWAPCQEGAGRSGLTSHMTRCNPLLLGKSLQLFRNSVYHHHYNFITVYAAQFHYMCWSLMLGSYISKQACVCVCVCARASMCAVHVHAHVWHTHVRMHTSGSWMTDLLDSWRTKTQSNPNIPPYHKILKIRLPILLNVEMGREKHYTGFVDKQYMFPVWQPYFSMF